MPPCSWIYASFLFTCICIVHAFPFSNSTTVSYTDHCSSIVPQSTPNNCTYCNFIPHFITPHFTGGESLLGMKAGNQPNQNLAKSLLLEFQPKFYGTDDCGIYKVEASLFIVYELPFYHNPGYSGSYYKTTREQETFLLEGFWSQISGNLCMVGSTYLEVEGGARVINLDAVLKLNYAGEDNPTVYTSLISGSFDSTLYAGDLGYFDPILIHNFPVFPKYNYSLVPKDLDGVFLNSYAFPKDRSLSLDLSSFCSVLGVGQTHLELEYAIECSDSQHCSPFGDRFSQFLPPFLSLIPLQCSEGERSARYLAKFQHNNFAYNTYDLDGTLIVEASWDDESNQLFGAGCRILNPADHFGSEVGDCTMRFSLRYPSILNITNEAILVGQIWSSKSAEESGYFRRINLTGTSENDVVALHGLRYEYTEVDRARKSCPVKDFEKNGKTYPVGNSSTLSTSFDVFVEGQKWGWGTAVPLFVGAEFFQVDPLEPEPRIRSENTPLNISYKIGIHLFGEAKWSKNPRRKMMITAEGEYDPVTGYLCMVGCRKLRPQIKTGSNHTEMDCDILVKFEFASLDYKGAFLKGSIESTRSEADHLNFPDLSLVSISDLTLLSGDHDYEVSLPTMWRLGSELSMLVTSNALSCLFVWLQIRHVRRRPEVASHVSPLMILMLSLGHMISAALNFQILFPSNHKNLNKQTFEISFEKKLFKTDKVTSMVISMIEFSLHIRLFYVVWNAKSNQRGNKDSSWIGERTASYITLSLCIFGCLLSPLLSSAMMLDAFLLPQIFLNILTDSAEKALHAAFYSGMSAIRLAPHAYNQHRKQKYPTSFNVEETYYYANPAAYFHSAAWDVIIPCGVTALAMILFLQQRRGGRCLLPQRFYAPLQLKMIRA